MADRTFTLDWRIRTRKHETLMRAKLGTLDTQLSFRKRVRGPVRLEASMLVPADGVPWFELGFEPEPPIASVHPIEIDRRSERDVAPEEAPTLRRASG